MRNYLFCLLILLPVSLLAGEVNRHSYEQTILNTIKDIQSLKHDQALDSTRNLIKQYPHSRLGQMLYADLLLAKAGPLEHIGSGIKVDRAVKDFRHEIQQRWQHETSVAHTGMYPESIISLSESQPYLILVDQQSSRIYVYRNDHGTPVLEADYFITIGLKGWGKQKRGDQKTPVGVYHVTRFIDGQELPDLYGKGAFPINYPNVWDERRKRTGSGIWIHGTPSYTYNRSPWASNGCIVVSNPDFMHIDQYISTRLRTPVVVTDQVNWLSQEQWQARRKQWLTTLRGWIGDWESLDHKRYLRHYSKAEFHVNGSDFKKWDSYKRRVNGKKTRIKVEYSDLNIFLYPGEQDLVMMQYEQDYASSNLELTSPKEIYWRKSKDRWQIVYEGTRTFPKSSYVSAQN